MRNSFYFFIGTTAELIKLAPVISELKKRKIKFRIIASNQNILYFDELEILMGKQAADYTFKTKGPVLNNIYLRFVFWAVKSFWAYLLFFDKEFKGKNKERSFLIVHGDTTTSLIGAFIAKICGVRLVHIESGLRSFNFLEPFPEEIARFIISYLADIHFCPNEWSLNNLKNHFGVKVNTFYNTIGESVHRALRDKRKLNLSIPPKAKYFILVFHRQEHTLFNKESGEKVIDQIVKTAKDDLKCIFIMHYLTKDYLIKIGLYSKLTENPNVILPERLPYPSFVKLMAGAEFIATDGGSNQEEAFFLGKPCLILRNRTERVEGLNKNACLSKLNKRKISAFLRTYRKYTVSPLLDSKVRPSAVIVDYLLQIR